jgi:hypothetical protein
MFIPSEVVVVHIVGFENLMLQSLLLNRGFMFSSVSLFVS